MSTLISQHSYRAIIPADWARKMGINEDDETFVLRFDEMEKKLKLKKLISLQKVLMGRNVL